MVSFVGVVSVGHIDDVVQCKVGVGGSYKDVWGGGRGQWVRGEVQQEEAGRVIIPQREQRNGIEQGF